MLGKWFRSFKNRLLSVALVVLLAGCQASGGMDLDAMLMNQLDIKTVEETGSFELIIDWNEQFIENNEDERFAALAKLLSHVRVDIENARADAEGRAAVKGTITLGGKAPIGFFVHTDQSRLYLEIEGAQQPLYIDVDGMTGGSIMNPALTINQSNDIATEMVKEAAVYFIRHLPNPPTLAITRENTVVGGQSQMMTKVHAEIKGDELGEWLITYVDALLQDEEGLLEMLRSVTEKMNEMYRLDPEMLKELGIPDEEAYEAADAGLFNFTDEDFEELLMMLLDARLQLEELRQGSEWDMIFDEGIELKMDVWVDDKLHVRKSDMELVIEPAVFKLPFSPVNSIIVRSHEENWNINGNVEIATPSGEGAWGFEDLMNISNHQLLRMLEEDSVLYDLLKNDFAIDDSYFLLSPYNFYGTAPYIAGDGTLMVPVRDALDRFEIRATYDHDTRTIRFYDEGTVQEIVLYMDSSTALVNGRTVQLGWPIVVIDDYSYMAAEDLFKLLRAVHTYEIDDWDELWVKVTRDL